MQRLAETRGNMVGIDPHKLTLSAAIVDERGGVVAVAHFKVSGQGHRALEAWVLSYGPVVRWGVEGASGLGRHTAILLCRRDHDVRDVNRTQLAAWLHDVEGGQPTYRRHRVDPCARS